MQSCKLFRNFAKFTAGIFPGGIMWICIFIMLWIWITFVYFCPDNQTVRTGSKKYRLWRNYSR